MLAVRNRLRRGSRTLIHRFSVQRTSLVALASGAATVAGFAPLYFYALPIVTLALLLWLWGHAGAPGRAAAIGWWFGVGFFLTGVSWVYVSLNSFGGMAAVPAALMTLLFCVHLALFPAAVGYAYARMRAPFAVKTLLIAPAAWTLTEWVRGWLFTGFPWLSIGYSQVPASPLAGYAPVLGVFGITLVSLTSAGLLVLLARWAGPKWSATIAALPQPAVRPRTVVHGGVLGLAIWGGGYALNTIQWTEPTGAPIRVALLQGNIAQDIKWTPDGLRLAFRTYIALALQSDAKLIVLPETALPLFLDEVPPEYADSLAAHARKQGSDVLIGLPERVVTGDYYNSVVSVGSSPPQAYRKSHLVPFGEFIPLRPLLGSVVGALSIPLQDFSSGSVTPKPLLVAGQQAAVNICYEDAFGEEIIRQLPGATLLVNVSNVAWFGRSIAPIQHLQISQTRALETGRYMLRATNTGATAIIDNRGKVLQIAPQFETAAVQGTAQGYTGTTPYVRWGNYAAVALCLLILVTALFASPQNKQ